MIKIAVDLESEFDSCPQSPDVYRVRGGQIQYSGLVYFNVLNNELNMAITLNTLFHSIVRIHWEIIKT